MLRFCGTVSGVVHENGPYSKFFIQDAEGHRATAAGYFLPHVPDVEYTFRGAATDNTRTSFKVSSWTVKSIPDSVPDEEAKKLGDLELKCYIMSRFSGPNKTFHRAVTWLDQHNMEDVKANPWILASLGFQRDTITLISEALGVSPESTAKSMVEQSLLKTLRSNEASGHMYMPAKKLIWQVKADLKLPSTTVEDVLLHSNAFVVDKGSAYLANSYWDEQKCAEDVVRILKTFRGGKRPLLAKLALKEYESKCGFKLDAKQSDAVLNAYRSGLFIITGGPGCGKTTVLSALLCAIAGASGKSFHPILLAPTGKAARRMAESTGYKTATIHSALHLADVNAHSDVTLNASVVIVDEASMLDMHTARELMASIPSGTQLILVGDIHQLPSVGCGNVLRELLSVVPFTKLVSVFRQKGGSPIVANAEKINTGDKSLEWSSEFAMVEKPDENDIYNYACSLYKRAREQDGADSVILLCPYRAKGAVCAYKFNSKLQAYFNPLHSGDPYIQIGNKEFRCGDRVIQTKNLNGVANGEVGVIQEISRIDGAVTATIDFSGETKEYSYEEMLNVDLAYCVTVHKSQGSEYKTVILALADCHANLLQRNMVYTAVTRAKKRVVIVGSKDALNKSIDTEEVSKRYTRLGSRVRNIYYK